MAPASYIASEKTIIMVSHDEAFLDAVTNHTWEMDPLHRAVSSIPFSAYSIKTSPWSSSEGYTKSNRNAANV